MKMSYFSYERIKWATRLALRKRLKVFSEADTLSRFTDIGGLGFICALFHRFPKLRSLSCRGRVT